MEDVVARDGVRDDTVAAQPACRQPAIFGEDRVVEDVLMPGLPFHAAGIAHLEEAVAGLLGRNLAAADHIAPDIERADGRGGIGDHVRGARDVVIPHAHVAPAAFHLEAIVPRVGDEVAIDVRVRSRRAAITPIRAAADGVVEHVLRVRHALVVADHVIPRGVEEADRLRAGGMGGKFRLIPVVRVLARVMKPAALDDNPRHLAIAADTPPSRS